MVVGASPKQAAGGTWGDSATERMLTAKLMSELYAAVDQDGPSSVGLSVLPQEYVRRKIVFRLEQGSLSLVEKGDHSLSTLVFSNVECRLDSCTDSHALSAKLQSMRLFHVDVPIISSGVTELGNDGTMLPIVEIGVQVRNSQVVAKHDFVLNLHVRPLSFLFSRPFTEGLVHFFVRGKGGCKKRKEKTQKKKKKKKKCFILNGLNRNCLEGYSRFYWCDCSNRGFAASGCESIARSD